MNTTKAGPANGTLSLHTGVEGKAAKMGHALTISIDDWDATATFDGRLLSSLELRARLDSLQVVKGDGGVKPLSSKDKTTIRDTALKSLKTAAHPEIAFTSTTITPTDAGYDVAGDLSVAGSTHPVSTTLQVREEDGKLRVTGDAVVVQTEFGVSPYSTMMGALKVRDRVDVRVDVSLPLP